MVEGCGHVGEGTGGGQRAALSTDRAGARQRIVHMSTACRVRSARPPAAVLICGPCFYRLSRCVPAPV